jgi:hypothetical protein
MIFNTLALQVYFYLQQSLDTFAKLLFVSRPTVEDCFTKATAKCDGHQIVTQLQDQYGTVYDIVQFGVRILALYLLVVEVIRIIQTIGGGGNSRGGGGGGFQTLIFSIIKTAVVFVLLWNLSLSIELVIALKDQVTNVVTAIKDHLPAFSSK